MPSVNNDYDAVRYPSGAYPDTHPGRLAVMGLLHGLNPAPVEHCRILDIGCNDGSNIIPMAYAIPGGEFVGFDLAASPIARAQRRIDELRLTNIRVFQADLMDVSGDLGQFDYIIAHGVYAWVPDPVRDALLAFCRRHLAPEGIAFVSYNALPGSHIRELVRDLLLQPMTGTGDPEQEFGRAMELLEFVGESRPQEDPYRSLLEKQAKQIRKKGPQAYFHDELAKAHQPILFSTFVSHAARHGLQYLSESTLPPPIDPCCKPEVVERVKSLADGDPLAEEQLLDFVRMRTYRETLLCHAGRPIDRDLRLDAFDRLRLASQAEAGGGEAGPRVYTLPSGIQIQSEHPPTIALMEFLIAAWPESVPITETRAFLEANGIAFDGELLTLLLRLIVARMVDLHAWAAPVSRRIALRPAASVVSRLEAATQPSATTLLHTVLGLSDPIVRRLLLLLDGTRNREELYTALREGFPDVPETVVADGLDPSLRLLHRTGVLMAEPAAEVC